ncbi:MAG: helix-turn-helix domain-containing protein [Paludibacteraceae bacterium]|nr:helix-turn-helix domain-containing protein [Paludibacteraceae bacterium]
MDSNNIPLLDCPVDYLIGDASGKVMNEYGRFPCKIQCGVYAYMVRGTARATININEYTFSQDDVLLLEPGSFLLIHEFSEDALVYYILFSSSFLEKNTFGNRMSLTALQLRTPIVHITPEKGSVIVDLYNMLVKASNTEPSMLSSQKMVHVFNLLQTTYSEYAQSTDEYVIHPQDRRTEIYQDYCQLVLKHYHEWHHVSQYATAMRITLPHLCSSIRQASDRTAADVINDAIITDAKAQLKLTTLQIKEIAMSLGFENVAFFNRFFKTHVGATPKAYRAAE